MNEKAALLLHEMPRFARRALSAGLAALLALSFTPRSLAYADSIQPGSDARIEAASDEGDGRAADSGGDADLLASYPMPTVRADATVRSSLVLLVKFKDDAWGIPISPIPGLTPRTPMGDSEHIGKSSARLSIPFPERRFSGRSGAIFA